MTESELRAWRDWLLGQGKSPQPFASSLEPRYEFDPTLEKTIECATDGKRYIVDVRNAELQRVEVVSEISGNVRRAPVGDCHIVSILNTLAEAEIQCLKLFYLDEYSRKEIAERTGFTETQVASLLRNGLRKVSSELKTTSEEDVKASLLRSLRPLASR